MLSFFLMFCLRLTFCLCIKLVFKIPSQPCGAYWGKKLYKTTKNDFKKQLNTTPKVPSWPTSRTHRPRCFHPAQWRWPWPQDARPAWRAEPPSYCLTPPPPPPPWAPLLASPPGTGGSHALLVPMRPATGLWLVHQCGGSAHLCRWWQEGWCGNLGFADGDGCGTIWPVSTKKHSVNLCLLVHVPVCVCRCVMSVRAHLCVCVLTGLPVLQLQEAVGVINLASLCTDLTHLNKCSYNSTIWEICHILFLSAVK